MSTGFYQVPTPLNEPIYAYSAGSKEKEQLMQTIASHRSQVIEVDMKINGKFVKTCAGKAGWQTVAHAKAAIKHHVVNMSGYEDMRMITGDGYSHEQNKEWQKFLNGLVEDGTVEFC